MTHVNRSDFDTELRLVPLKCGTLSGWWEFVMVHSPLLTLGIFLCITNSLSFFAPWNSYISVMTCRQQSDHPQLNAQGLQNQPRPDYSLSSSPEKSGERMREKRNSGQEYGGGGAAGGGAGGGHQGQTGQGGLTLSVTANFYALQQKLMRELWRRNSRVISSIDN